MIFNVYPGMYPDVCLGQVEALDIEAAMEKAKDKFGHLPGGTFPILYNSFVESSAYKVEYEATRKGRKTRQ